LSKSTHDVVVTLLETVKYNSIITHFDY